RGGDITSARDPRLELRRLQPRGQDGGRRDGMKVSLAHSPDSDDAFMFYGLARGKVATDGLEIVHVLKDIQTLNEEARVGRHEVTAISFHAWPHVADTYALMPCGGSIGDGYGPLLVARQALRPSDVAGRVVAVPGTLTTAYLALRLFAPDAQTRVVPFDRILDEVREERADVGLIIHEGQLTFGGHGLHKVRTWARGGRTRRGCRCRWAPTPSAATWAKT